MLINIEGRLAELRIYTDPAGVISNALGFATGGILANGILSEIIGSIVSGLSGSREENMCVAANSTARKAPLSLAKNKQQRKAPNEGENVFDSIGDGLKSLFSR